MHPFPDIILLETPFLSPRGTVEVRAYVQSKYNLALLAIGSYVRHHSKYDIRIISMVKDQLDSPALLSYLRPKPPKLIGISLTSYNLRSSYEVIQQLKSAFPSTHICVGGVHANIFPRETIALAAIDSMVLGDGEIPFLAICQQIMNNGELLPNRLPTGCYTKESARGISDFHPCVLPSVNELPVPDLSLLGDPSRYRDYLSNKTMGLLTSSRGCPFVCRYCRSRSSTYRPYPIDYVIRCLKSYRAQGIQYVEFWDETFNSSKKRLHDFADAMLDANIDLTWNIRGAVVNHVPLEALVKLKRTGLRLVQFGVETTRPRLLEYLDKRITPEMVTDAFLTCRKAGIRTVANLMIGIPGQTGEEIKQDLEFMRQLNPTYVSISIYNWAPGTALYQEAMEQKLVSEDYWRKYAMAPYGEEPVRHPQLELPTKSVYRLRDKFQFSFYFRPSYVFHYLRQMNASEIIRAFQIAGLMLRSRLYPGKDQSHQKKQHN